LGKTHIAMAVNERLREENKVTKTLVLCPNYLKWKWASELATYTDSNYCVLNSTSHRRKLTLNSFEEGYLVVNYELLLQDWQQLIGIGFDVVIADEVTRIKNYQSKTKKLLKKFKPEYRWGLTGTPVSNRPDELYSIADWIDEYFFEKWYYFDKKYIVRNYFGGVERYVNLKELAERTSKIMISKTQEEVGSELPEVITETLPLEFTRKQAKLYDEVATSLELYLDVMLEKLLDSRNTDHETAKIRERFNALRMSCVCPLIFEHSTSKYIRQSMLDYHDEGAKIAAIKQLIDEKIKGTRDKMIIFSFYRGVVPIIAEYLDHQKIGYRILIGGMDAREAQDNIQDFSNKDSCQIFITTEAGDKGIDLQMAKYLVNVDIPFSWEKYEQRIGRMKRVGAKHKTTIVYNLVMKDSFEERQLQIVMRKGELSEAIRGKSDIDEIKPVDQSLRKFLKGE